MAIRAVSYVVILIIMAVMANTMSMTARERTSEYATLKALGFSPFFVARIDRRRVTAHGCARWAHWHWPDLSLGRGLSLGHWHPLQEFCGVFGHHLMQMLPPLVTGVFAALWPAIKSYRIRIVEGLRAI